MTETELSMIPTDSLVQELTRRYPISILAVLDPKQAMPKLAVAGHPMHAAALCKIIDAAVTEYIASGIRLGKSPEELFGDASDLKEEAGGEGSGGS